MGGFSDLIFLLFALSVGQILMALIRRFGQASRLFELSSQRSDQTSASARYLVVRMNHARVDDASLPNRPRPAPAAPAERLAELPAGVRALRSLAFKEDLGKRA